MKTIAFFNNKGGVGKTTLVYHLSHMFARHGYRAVALDFDPQANLTSSFLDEDELERLWDDGQETVLACVDPILQGTGSVAKPKTHAIRERLWLVAGDLGLSRFEDALSLAWAQGFGGSPAALRNTASLFQIVRFAAEETTADVALLDVGPNLGAINRAALLSADYLVVPLAADLYSLQGLKNLGPTVQEWRSKWKKVLAEEHPGLKLPAGKMTPAGYVVLQHAVRADRPAKAFAKWIDRIPAAYSKAVLGEAAAKKTDHALASLRNYRSLMPMAQDARKPMFDLKASDGAIGSHAKLVATCSDEFATLAEAIAEACGLEQG